MRLLIFFSFQYFLMCSCNQNFSINFESNTFVKDGHPFRYISGSIHYFRIPRELWMDRLTKVRALGLNAIQFVIPWNLHEPMPGNFVFSDGLDVETFIKMAQDLGLLVLLRPGPYICAERDGGGLPFWLYQQHRDIKLRSSDSNFLSAVDSWWNQLLPRMKPLLYQNGGPIILVQLENEYGSYGLQTGKCDIVYMNFLRDSARKHLGNQVILYTTDGAADDYVRCGKTADVYATVDFGPGRNVNQSFAPQRHFEPRGPLVNSEFYPGWLDYWGSPHNKVDANSSAKSLDEILATGANVNIYMIHGGTSFGFENGVNTNPFNVEPTSYDYDAPISEAGDLTFKYEVFKEVIKKYVTIPSIQVNASVPKEEYGQVEMEYASNFFFSRGMLLKTKQTNTLYPITFEDIKQDRGFVLYETQITNLFSDPSELKIETVHDRAIIYLNEKFVGIMSRAHNINSMPISVLPDDKLQILVENQGRVGYGPDAKDFKGILSNVTLGDVNLTHWNVSGLPLDDGKAVEKYVKSAIGLKKKNPKIFHKNSSWSFENNGYGSFWYGEFKVPCQESERKNTFLRLQGWTKGVAFLNGFNLGRYWPVMGPQQTLYVPAPKLNPPCQNNTLILFELGNPGCRSSRCIVDLVSSHVIDGPTPVNKKRRSSISFTRNFQDDFEKKID